MRIYDQNIIPELTFQEILGMNQPVEEFLYNPQAFSGTFEGSTVQGGKKKFDNTETGFIMGVDGGTPKFYIGNTTNYINWTGTALNIVGGITATTGSIGGFDIGTDYIRDVANSFGLASTVTGGDDVRFWAGATFANRATAPFRVTEAGVLAASSVTLSGSVAISGIANNANTDIHLLDFTHNITFSASDEDTIAWTSGTITLSNGRTFAISAGNTGDMAAETYIYLSPADSTTVLQTTTTVTTAIGANKILLGVAENTNEFATFMSARGVGGLIVDGDSIKVRNLGAISATLGYVQSGLIRGSTIETSLDGTGTRFKLTDTAFQGYDASENVVFEVVLAGGGNEIAVDSYSDANFSHYVRINGTTDGYGQSLTGVAGDLINAKFKIARVGTLSGNIVAKLYAHSGTFGTSSVPTGAALATSDNIDVSTINTYYTSVTFIFSAGNQYTMSAATKYVIAIEYSSASSTNYLKVATDASSPTHGGNRSTWNGSSWSAVSSSDMIFAVNATTGTSDVGDVILGDDATGKYAKWDNSAGTFKVFADNITGDTVSLVTYSNEINGTTTPVPVFIASNGAVLLSDANDTDRDSFFGFCSENLTAALPAQYLTSATNTTNRTFSFTLLAGTDRFLIIQINMRTNTAQVTVPTSVTWNGNTCTKLLDNHTGTTAGMSIWYYAAGTNGSNQTGDVVITGGNGLPGDADESGGNTIVFAAQYVDQTDAVQDSDIQRASSGSSVTTNITTDESYNLVVQFHNDKFGNAITVDTELTNRNTSDTSSKQADGYIAIGRAVVLTSSTSSTYDATDNGVAASIALRHSSSLATNISIPGRVVTGFSGLTAGSKYYVQDTIGTIGTSPGTATLLVGVAINATSIITAFPT